MRLHRPSLPALAVAAVWLAACAPARGAQAGSGTLRLATWNVENLFDEIRQGDAPEELVPSAQQVGAKLAALGAVLKTLDADVVAVQEVENRGLLERLGAPGYRAFLEEGWDPRGIDVGVLSRLTASGAPIAHGEGDLFPRPPLEVRLERGGRRIVLLVAHLKSKLGGEASDVRRLQQARRLRAIADEAAARSPDALVVLAGDLNDEPGSAALATLVGDGAWVDVAARAPAETTWTYSYRGRHERVDYVLVRARDASRVRSVSSARVPRRASDHRPVVVELSF